MIQPPLSIHDTLDENPIPSDYCQDTPEARASNSHLMRKSGFYEGMAEKNPSKRLPLVEHLSYHPISRWVESPCED